jgi:hypothetical protein
MRNSIAEVFDELKKARFNGDRIFILRKNDSMALRGLLKMNYDKSLTLALPPGVPPYNKKSVPVGFGDATLLTSAKGWYIFSKETAPNLTQTKREFMFISLLESLDPKEAEILLLAKDRKLNLNLTHKVINDVFPGLIKDFLESAEFEINNIDNSDEIVEDGQNEKKRGRGRPKKHS